MVHQARTGGMKIKSEGENVLVEYNQPVLMDKYTFCLQMLILSPELNQSLEIES